MITRLMLRAAIAAVPLLAAGAATAGEAGDFAGTFSGTIVKQEARPLDDKGHVVVAQAAQGTNRSTGKTDYMNGAQVLWSSTIEIAGGNGPEHGLITLVKDGVSATSSYSGTLKTTLVDGRPLTTGSGTWTMVSASGMASEGSGTYAITMTSPTTFEGEWKGDTSATAARAGSN